MPQRLSLLDCALLGLLARGAMSGYGLRRVFQDTALGRYSDSPGSIYPALRRLETRGFIRRVGRAGPRGRRPFAASAKGLGAFLAWLARPATLNLKALARAEVQLKLAFLSDHHPPEALPAFLSRFAESLDGVVAEASASRRALGDQLSASGRVALDLGIHQARSTAAWCRRRAQRERHTP